MIATLLLFASALRAAPSALRATPRMSLPPLAWRPEGHSYWQWDSALLPGGGCNVHFLVAGPEDARPLVLVHGFGASWFHWRYNVPELSKRFRVYAVDLVGFGSSDKPLAQYTPQLWAQQLADFVSQVVAPRAPCKAAIAGNSLGGFASLAAAVIAPELFEGVALLNAAGQFAQPQTRAQPAAGADGALPAFCARVQQRASELARRAVLFGSFQLSKQPSRIRQVLGAVYSVDGSNVDELLVQSIAAPAAHPNAAEVFYRIVSRNALTPSTTIDALLAGLPAASDVLLLWGEADPWIRPITADKIQRLRPTATRVSVDAGHCPHDEAPAQVNAALAAWMDRLPAASLVLPVERILAADRWPPAVAAQP